MSPEKPSETVFITVSITRDEHGRVISDHFPQGDQDAAILATWPSAGMEQVAFGLLTEAVRREALLDVILNVSHHPEIRSKWSLWSDDDKQTLIERLTKGATKSMNSVIDRLIRSAMRTTLDAITVDM